MTNKKIYIEFSELDQILESVKTAGKNHYANDGEIRKVIDDVFFEIDKALIMFEGNHQEQGELKQ